MSDVAAGTDSRRLVDDLVAFSTVRAIVDLDSKIGWIELLDLSFTIRDPDGSSLRGC